MKNYVQFTLKALKDGEVNYTPGGKIVAKVFSVLSMGKDENGNFRPGLTMSVTCFADNFEDPRIAFIGEIKKQTWFDVEGNLKYNEYKGKGYITLIVSAVSPHIFEEKTKQQQDEEF